MICIVLQKTRKTEAVISCDKLDSFSLDNMWMKCYNLFLEGEPSSWVVKKTFYSSVWEFLLLSPFLSHCFKSTITTIFSMTLKPSTNSERDINQLLLSINDLISCSCYKDDCNLMRPISQWFMSFSLMLSKMSGSSLKLRTTCALNHSFLVPFFFHSTFDSILNHLDSWTWGNTCLS